VNDRGQVTDQLQQEIGTTRIGGTTYDVYGRSTHLQPLLDTTVAPDHSGQPLIVALQRYYNGAWHTIWTNTTVRLKGGSAVYTALPWTSMPTYGLYRVIAEYHHDNTDTSNIDTWGNWAYFTIHP
jgi:hypothetical protein